MPDLRHETYNERRHRLYIRALEMTGPFTLADIARTSSDYKPAKTLMNELIRNGDMRRLPNQPSVYEWIND